MKMQSFPETPGIHTMLLNGIEGPLEVEVTVPSNVCWDKVAMLGHPHSLQGGTMHNKVVTTLGRVFSACQIPSVRFNFRGVGQSAGKYDAGIGESEDMLWLTKKWLSQHAEARVYFAGFSFGSYVAARAASVWPAELLVSIAPPVHHYDYHALLPFTCPWVIVQGEADDVVPSEAVRSFVDEHAPQAMLESFVGTGHFFHGQLLELKSCLLRLMHRYGWDQ